MAEGGHAVDFQKLLERYPGTQQAIRHALPVADAVVLVDNSRHASLAFTPCYIRADDKMLYDIRSRGGAPSEIASWLDVVVDAWRPELTGRQRLSFRPSSPGRTPISTVASSICQISHGLSRRLCVAELDASGCDPPFPAQRRVLATPFLAEGARARRGRRPHACRRPP